MGGTGYWTQSYSDGQRDPWGNELVLVYANSPPTVSAYYSTGPNGIDERGRGDDLGATEVVPTFGAPEVAFVWAREALLALGLLVLAGRFGLGILAAFRSESLLVEGLRAIALALPLTVLLVGGTVLLAGQPGASAALVELVLIGVERATVAAISPLLSLAALFLGLTTLLCLAFRLAQPTREELASSPNLLERRPFEHVDAAILSIALVVLTQAPFVRPLWRALDPEMQATQAYVDDSSVDPWGNPWCSLGDLLDGPTWSAGPNGVDERQGGDDLTVDYGLGRDQRQSLYLQSPWILVVSACGVAALWLFGRLTIWPLVARYRRQHLGSLRNQSERETPTEQAMEEGA